MNVAPDSALTILDALESSSQGFPQSTLRRWQLLRLMAWNKCDTVFRSDSLQRVLTDYYDRHDTPNERMWAHYLLGRAYYDMGEALPALKAYEDATAAADTTAGDCDFWNLCRVYFMLSELHLQSMMPKEMLSTLSLARTTAGKAGDTISSIMAVSRKALAYEILGDDDSIIICSEEASRMSLLHGEKALSSQCLSVAIPPLVKRGELAKAAEYINLYEGFSGFFDDSHDIQKGCEIYYHTKGAYYLEAGKTDSAEWMFRKLLGHAQTINDLHAAYLGLRNRYGKTGPADSLAKYAVLSEVTGDSLYLSTYRSDLQRNERLYDYSRYLEKAKKLQTESDRKRFTVIALSSLLLLLVLASAALYFFIRMRHKTQLLEYKNLLSQLEQQKADEEHESEKEKQRLTSRMMELQSAINKDISHDLDQILAGASVVKRIKDEVQTKQEMSEEDWEELNMLFNREHPNFRHTLCVLHGLTDMEYRVCQLVRLHLSPHAVSSLMGNDLSYASTVRKRLHQKIMGKEGKAKQLDGFLFAIPRVAV